MKNMSFLKLASPLLLLLSTVVTADTSQRPILTQSNSRSHRIAIIGGGAAGSSAAYHLRKFANDTQLPVALDITLLETTSRIGGRTTTVNAFDDDSIPIELGASIFVQANHILYNASLEFGLQSRRLAHTEESEPSSDYDLGIWDGTQFVFKQSSSGSRWQDYWDIVKLLWKYGYSPVRLNNAVKETVGKFLNMYNEPIFPFSSLRDTIEEVDLMDMMAVTGDTVMLDKGISEAFAHDIWQASTRVNYASNLNQIHGVESMVSMATDGAMAIADGNYQIFEEMVRRAGIETIMSSAVDQVVRNASTGEYQVKSKLAGAEKAANFDTIVLAAPYQFANIDFLPALREPPEAIDYIALHVTIFASPHLLSPKFFQLGEQKAVPSTILTTLPFRSLGEHDPSFFFSISTLRTVPPGKHSAKTQYVYKIFSHQPLKASSIADLYGFEFVPNHKDGPNAGIETLEQDHISWYHHKLWHSYPVEKPRSTFEKIKLDGDIDEASGVWYTSGIEPFISTMETSALMGRNVAKLIVDRVAEKDMPR
jgi:prenylcysteine oxidase / farnesylcysteine lyase